MFYSQPKKVFYRFTDQPAESVAVNRCCIADANGEVEIECDLENAHPSSQVLWIVEGILISEGRESFGVWLLGFFYHSILDKYITTIDGTTMHSKLTHPMAQNEVRDFECSSAIAGVPIIQATARVASKGEPMPSRSVR